MNELNTLKIALQSMPASEWVSAALSALANPSTHFAGSTASGASGRADELRRIYEIRLAHLEERGIRSPGLKEIVSELRVMADTDRLLGVPFLSDTHAVSAFYRLSGALVGCITLEWDPNRGMQNLAAALGNQ